MNRRGTMMHMMFFGFLLQLVSVEAVHWGDFVKDECIEQGYRKYHAKLFDIVGSWEDACWNTPATVAGVYFDHPTKCVTKIDGEYGEFHVRDTSCDPYWGDFVKDECIERGYRKYHAKLFNIVGSWEDGCWNSPATVAGVYFEKPTDCVNKIDGEYGEFHVRDTSCDPQWSPFSWQNYKCSGGTAKAIYWSTLENVQGDWMDWCQSTPAVVLGVYFTEPTRCVEAGILWGEHHAVFQFADPCCIHDEERSGLSEMGFTSFGSDSYLPGNATGLFGVRGGSCSREQGRPPSLPPGTPTPEEVLRALLTASFDVITVLARLYAPTQFRITGTSGTSIVERIFNAYFQNSELQFNTNDPGPVSHSSVSGLVVPTTPSRRIYYAGGSFPVGTYLTLDVGQYSGQSRIICTDRLSGCCLAFGWDRGNNRFYMAHVQPDASGEIEAISNRVNLANYLRQNQRGQFPGTSSSDIEVTYFGGDGDQFWGYDGGVNAIGFIESNRVTIVLQLFRQDLHSPDKIVVRTWIRTFPEGA